MAITYHTQNPLYVAREIGNDTRVFHLSAPDAESVKHCVQSTVDALGSIDILVNAAKP
ncbi:MAG: hypothetical protein M0C28_31970 [Candidatus Moduliflexus flocculans]|nr:hypothetical protein [Candidatus Moduliflexus flocculans]